MPYSYYNIVFSIKKILVAVVGIGQFLAMQAHGRHVLAKLREIIGLSQSKFAELVGVTPHTIQSIETGRLPLSRKLADRISFETWVNKEWLQQNDPSKAVVSKIGTPYSAPIFEAAQAENKEALIKPTDALIIPLRSAGALKVVLATALAAYVKGNHRTFSKRLETALSDIEEDLGLHELNPIFLKALSPPSGEYTPTELLTEFWDSFNFEFNAVFQSKIKADPETYETFRKLAADYCQQKVRIGDKTTPQPPTGEPAPGNA